MSINTRVNVDFDVPIFLMWVDITYGINLTEEFFILMLIIFCLSQGYWNLAIHNLRKE